MTDATLLTTRRRPAVRLQLRSWFPCDVIVEGGRSWAIGAGPSSLSPDGTAFSVDWRATVTR